MITRYAPAGLAFCCALAAPLANLNATAELRERGGTQPSVTYSINLFEEILESAPAPDPDGPRAHGPSIRIAAGPVNGSAAGRTQIEFNFRCDFSAEDENGGNWSWTYVAKLFDPSNNLIKLCMANC